MKQVYLGAISDEKCIKCLYRCRPRHLASADGICNLCRNSAQLGAEIAQEEKAPRIRTDFEKNPGGVQRTGRI